MTNLFPLSKLFNLRTPSINPPRRLDPAPNPTGQFGHQAVFLELRALTAPDSLLASPEEASSLIKKGWVKRLPCLRKQSPMYGSANVVLGDRNIVEQTYVSGLTDAQVSEFLNVAPMHFPTNSTILNLREAYTRDRLIRAESTNTCFKAHPLVAAAIVQVQRDLYPNQTPQFSVNKVFGKNFPNVFKLFGKSDDSTECRSILEQALVLMYEAFPETKQGLFFPVFEIIGQGIK
jgi:hypothetical protein